MEIELALLADAASTPPDGKLYILGGAFEELRATTFPVTHPAMSLVLRLKLHPTECDREHRLTIELWDTEGQRIGPQLAGPFRAQRRQDYPGRHSYVSLVFNLLGLQFAAPGEYNFHISVNGQHMRTVSLHLVKIETLELPSRGPAQR